MSNSEKKQQKKAVTKWVLVLLITGVLAVIGGFILFNFNLDLLGIIVATLGMISLIIAVVIDIKDDIQSETEVCAKWCEDLNFDFRKEYDAYMNIRKGKNSDGKPLKFSTWSDNIRKIYKGKNKPDLRHCFKHIQRTSISNCDFIKTLALPTEMTIIAAFSGLIYTNTAMSTIINCIFTVVLSTFLLIYSVVKVAINENIYEFVEDTVEALEKAAE